MCKLFSSRKILTISALLLSGIAGFSHAATISFGGVKASDESGLTSQYIDPITGASVPGNYLIETFDAKTGIPGFPGSTKYTTDGYQQDCAVNSINAGPLGINIDGNVGEINVRKDTQQKVAAAPAGDNTCYGYITNNKSGVAHATFDYSPMLAFFDGMYSEQAPFGITYLGFYWGSVDTYNSFAFYSGETLVGSLSGQELLNELNGAAGDRTGIGSNVYVNIDFSLEEQFDRMVVSTSGIAGEFDNIAIGITGQLANQATAVVPVSAPSVALLFVLGLAGVGVTRRLKK